MTLNSEKIDELVPLVSVDSAVEKQPTTIEVIDPKSERVKATRHPRWTRQETIILIEAKKMVENGEQLCRFKSSSGLFLNHHSDLKWDMVSSCCQQQGVERGPIQCRKRWGNLLTDFRKIKKWESNIIIKDELGESFWIMRNDKRKENKLPGFFDEVVYRVLDGGVLSASALPLNLIKMAPKPDNGVDYVEEYKDDDEDEEDEENEDMVDSEKMNWGAENIFETNMGRNILSSPMKTPASKGTLLRGSLKITPTFTLPTPGCEREPMSQEGYKRRRLSSPDNSEETTDLSNDNNIIKVLRRNTNIMKAYLGAQNMNHELAIEQQKEQSNTLVAVLGKLTDAITKIADKL